ncbi:MAG: OmpP1/FadL family transporter [Polyangiales bacterium]
MNKWLPGGSRVLLALLSCATSAVGVLAASPASASGYLTARFGADHGSPVASNPYAIYYNPGAIGMSPAGTQILIDGSLVIRSASYERTNQALSPSNDVLRSDPNYARSNTGTAKLTNVLVLPYLGATSDLGTKNLHVGYAFYVPFGGSATWKQNKLWDGNQFAPGAVDGPQRWSNISGSITALFNTVAAAYRIEKARLSVGVNASLVYQTVSTVRARNVDGSDDVRGLNGALKEGRSYIDVSGTTYAFSVGLLWDPIEDGSLRIGASYTTRPGFKETRLKGSLTNQAGADKAASTPVDVDLLQSWPDIFRAGLAYRPSPNSEIRIDGEYVRWSVFERQCVVERGANCNLITDKSGLTGAGDGNVVLNIPRGWVDTMGLRFGGAYFPTAKSEIFGSLAVSTSAVPKEHIDPSTIDADQGFITVGGRYQLTKKLGMAASFTQIIYGSVDTEGKSQSASYAPTSRSPRMDGIYKQSVSLINVNATYSF